jgi:general secretion pathway protein A
MDVTKLEGKYAPERFLSHFFLTEEPFALTPDPRFLYLSSGHAEALASIDNGVTGRKGLIVLRGEMGTGKTTLAHSILNQWPNQIHVAYVGTGTFSADDILRRAIIDFGLDPSGSPDDWDDRFERFLHQARDDGRLVVLMIDEAQRLSDETFAAITRLFDPNSNGPPLVQVVLIGQPELSLCMKKWKERHPSLPTGSIQILGLLSRRESLDYIAHRIVTAGGLPQIFRPRALRLILRECRGIPRRLNVVCHNALSIAFLQGQEHVDLDIARRAIAQSGTAAGHKTRSTALKVAAIALPVMVGASYITYQWHQGRVPGNSVEAIEIDPRADQATGSGLDPGPLLETVSDRIPEIDLPGPAPASLQVRPSETRVARAPTVATSATVVESAPAQPLLSESTAATPEIRVESSAASSRGKSSVVGASEVVVARDVVGRKPRGRGSSFPVDVGRLYLWTRLSTELQTRVEHVWYFEDVEQARVELELGGNWRVWSSKEIRPDQVGHWRVDVVDAEGAMVDTVSFDTLEARSGKGRDVSR